MAKRTKKCVTKIKASLQFTVLFVKQIDRKVDYCIFIGNAYGTRKDMLIPNSALVFPEDG